MPLQSMEPSSPEQQQSTPASLYPSFDGHHTPRSDTPPPPFFAHGSAPVTVLVPERQNSFSSTDIEKQFVKTPSRCNINRRRIKKWALFGGLFLLGIAAGSATCMALLNHCKHQNTPVEPPKAEPVQLHETPPPTQEATPAYSFEVVISTDRSSTW